MPHLLIHHKVQNFDTWKPGYDDHKPARDSAGLKELHLLRGIQDANDVVILFQAADLDQARAFVSSDDLKQTMARLGVIGTPQIVELQ